MDGRSSGAGPGLANGSGVDGSTSSSTAPSARSLPIAVVVVSALFVLGLYLAGYPGWRVALAAALLACMIPASLPASVAARVRRRERSLGPALSTAIHVAVVAVTGGLHSPFLVAIVGPFTGVLQTFGWSRATHGAIAVIVAGGLAMALLPAAWFGPPVPEPAYSLLTAMVLVAVAATNVGIFLVMTRALNAVRAEVDRARGQLAAQALSRARELEQLGAQLSHELKNPLGAIKTLVQLSARDAADDRSRQRLSVAEAEIERMGGILKEYLSFSRPVEKLHIEPLELAPLADEVVQVLEPQAADAGVALRRTGGARARGDARRLKEALFNLVANAIEATPRGGSVTIGIEADAEVVRIAVRDSGRGMPRDVLERIGTPFFTTRDEGTGLGVAMARATFVQLGGALEYRSAEGRGTTALASLPSLTEATIRHGAPAAR